MLRRICLLGMLVLLVGCGSTAEILPPVATIVAPAATIVAVASPVTASAIPTRVAARPSATSLPPTPTPRPSATPTTTPKPSPTPVPTPRPATPPVRLQIPAIGLDEAPIAVGLDSDRVPIVPKHRVGWYNLSATPGQGDNVVLWGHVLRWLDSPKIPAPFVRMKELGIGAKVIVTTSDGKVHHYRVTHQLEVRPSDVQYILPLGSERVTMVSCIGDTVITDGTLTKTLRLLTIAEPAS